MIQHIKAAAESTGIIAVITNSEEKIETQLNKITRDEVDPIMLISWDITTELVFDSNGFLENPSAKIVALLVTKPEDTTRELAFNDSEEMGKLFEVFIQKLYAILILFQRSLNPPISEVSYKLVPKHGAGKHAGVLVNWTMRDDSPVCTNG